MADPLGLCNSNKAMISKFIVSKNFSYFRGGRAVLFFINSVGKSSGNHEKECKSAGHVTTAAQLSSLAVRIMVRRVIRTASGGGLGTRLQVVHERSRICACEIGDLELLMRPGLRNLLTTA